MNRSRPFIVAWVILTVLGVRAHAQMIDESANLRAVTTPSSMFQDSDPGSWSVVTATKVCPVFGGAGCCTVAADCCDDTGCQCNAGKCTLGGSKTLGECEGILRSVRVHPTDANVVLLGGVHLYRSTVAGSNIDYSFKGVGINTLHEDHWGLRFNPSTDPTIANVFYAAGDGGIWSTNDIRQTPVGWNNLNGTNLANVEFYRGAIDPQNYGASAGGTQDNGYIRGGVGITWARFFGGDGYSVIVNPKDSRDLYIDGYNGVETFISRSTDGGGTSFGIMTGIALNGAGQHDIVQESLTADYGDCSATACRSLVVYSNAGHSPYRTTNAGSSWQQIASVPPLPIFKSFAIAPSNPPPSNLVFGVACDQGFPNGYGVWRTSNASSWNRFTDTLPNRCLSGMVIDVSRPCNTTACTLYVAASGFDENPTVPRHVFQSVDSGQHWTNITGTGSTALPNIPVNKVIMHPTNPNILYVGTDMGVYQGTLTGGVWNWAIFLTGLPKAAVVTDLTAHADSGILRAWTFGRSVWEAKAFTPVSSDAKVNTSSPTNEAKAPRMSSTSGGEQYAVTWADDRSGANNWHVRYQTYDASATRLQLLDLPVDDGSNHVAQYPAIATHPTSLLSEQCSWEAWQDDRLDRVNHINHIFYNYICGNGYRYFPTSDMQADTQVVGLNAQFPALTWLPAVPSNAFFAVAWQADRSAPNGFQDVYLRFFSPLGPRNGVPTIRVNSTNSEGRAPAVASDANDNVYIVWQSGSSQYLRIAKYDSNGVKIQPGPALDGNGIALGSDVSLAVVNGNPPTVIATYWATGSNGLPTVFRTRLRGDFLSIIGTEQVDQPPAVPAGAQQAWQPSVAVDGSNQGVISWHTNVNAADGSSLTAFARGFDSSGAWVKNDFRIDFSDRAKVDSVRVARTAIPKQFAYTWRDNRSGRYEIYTRVVPSLP